MGPFEWDEEHVLIFGLGFLGFWGSACQPVHFSCNPTDRLFQDVPSNIES